MSGWHPDGSDGGLLPSADPNNPAQAFDPTVPPIGTSPNYYGNGCDVRLRPAVVNSLISENLSVVDSVGLAYNPSSLINLRTAIEYIEQKSLPEFAVLQAQGVPTNYYTGALYPPLLGGYNNGMTLCVVPNAINQGFVRIDVGGGTWVPVLRNDYAELESGDWPASIPQCIAYFNGAFYMLGLCLSQVPVVLKGTINFWIRPDGNDATGDGTANAPDKAFRTIDGAWSAVGSRYSASPSSHIAMYLGVPGDYEGGALGPYGAAISLTGDPNTPGNYRVHAKNFGGMSACVVTSGVNQFNLTGVQGVMDLSASMPVGNHGLYCSRSAVTIKNVNIVLAVDHPFNSSMLMAGNQTMISDVAGIIGEPSSAFRFVGNGNSVANVMYWAFNSSLADHNPNFFTPPIWSFEQIRAHDSGLVVIEFSVAQNTCRQWVQNLCTGRRYYVSNTSNLHLGGRGQPPGDTEGYLGPFSVVNP